MYYAFNQFTSACQHTYANSMVAMANMAIAFLNKNFFSSLPGRARAANDSEFVIERKTVQAFIAKSQQDGKKVDIQWPLDEITTQVMFFIAATLEGAEPLYTNGSMLVHNPLVSEVNEKSAGPEEAKYFYKTEFQKDTDITVNMSAGLPTGFYDPRREMKKAAQTLPKSHL